jgi:putative transcriptional regulator
MPIRYKRDVIAALKSAGYSTYRIRKDKLLGEATLQKLRRSEPVSWENIATLCALLGCQPGDILEYTSEDAAERE